MHFNHDDDHRRSRHSWRPSRDDAALPPASRRLATMMDLAMPFAVLLGLRLLFIAFAWAAPSRNALVVLTSMWAAAAAAGLLWAAGLCWSFRDGLGPDMIDTHGAEAARRFWEEFQGAVAVVSVELAVLLAGYRWRTRRLSQANVRASQ